MDGNLGLSEHARQRALAAVAMAAEGNRGFIISLRLASPIARTRQDHLQLLLQHRLDEAAHMDAHTVLDRVAPIIEK